MGLTEYIFKSRSGIYKDNAENRRLHRVGQRYGEPARERYNDKHDNNGKDEYASRLSKEFRGLQERSLRLSDKEVRGFRSGSTEPNEQLRGTLRRVLGVEIARFRSSNRNVVRVLKHPTKDIEYNIAEGVNPRLFHDVFQIVRQYLRSGDAVDLHDDYSECKCYLSTDGLAGFAIEPDGNLVSVFSLGKGFLSSCGQYIVEQGARKLDCFASKMQDLPSFYKHTLGFEVASILDFNREMLEEDKGKEYADHFVSTYGEAPVMFMVRGENIPVRHFGKDDYDGAVAYQNSFLAGENIHKSLTDCLLLKARSGVYKDTPENRRLHRVGQRYGDTPTEHKQSSSKISYEEQESQRQFNKAKELLEALKKRGLNGYTISRSVKDWGVSTYIQGYNGNAPKFRISDHSVMSPHRVLNEVHFNYNSDVDKLADLALSEYQKFLEGERIKDEIAEKQKRETQELDSYWNSIKDDFKDKVFKKIDRTYQTLDKFLKDGQREKTNVFQKEISNGAYSYEWAEPVNYVGKFRYPDNHGFQKPSYDWLRWHRSGANTVRKSLTALYLLKSSAL